MFKQYIYWISHHKHLISTINRFNIQNTMLPVQVPNSQLHLLCKLVLKWQTRTKVIPAPFWFSLSKIIISTFSRQARWQFANKEIQPLKFSLSCCNVKKAFLMVMIWNNMKAAANLCHQTFHHRTNAVKPIHYTHETWDMRQFRNCSVSTKHSDECENISEIDSCLGNFCASLQSNYISLRII